jgi:DNA replication and repair protein RecF
VQLKWLYARNFRAIEELEIQFFSGINEIIGDNGQGKTSLLEAIHLLISGSSFRTSTLTDLVAHGKEGFFLACEFEKQGIDYTLEMSFDGSKKRVLLNKRLCDSISQLIGQVVGVVCTTEVQELVKGSPQLRRHFLDLQLAQTDPLYVHHLSRYSRALKQRNALLRTKNIATIAIWEQQLALSASYITEKRQEISILLQPLVQKIHAELTLQPSLLEIWYQTKAPVNEGQEAMQRYFEREYHNKRQQELLYGMTQVGPHRDDLIITLYNKSVRDFASEGEMRLIALSLKLAEWQMLKERTQDTPLMAIDDFAAFLDPQRIHRLFSIMQTLGQTFLTSQRPIGENKNRFQLSAGKLQVS